MQMIVHNLYGVMRATLEVCLLIMQLTNDNFRSEHNAQRMSHFVMQWSVPKDLLMYVDEEEEKSKGAIRSHEFKRCGSCRIYFRKTGLTLRLPA